MEGWFSKNLGDPLLAAEALGRIEAAFRDAFTAAGQPNGMALFLRHESEGRLHCELKLYFSPAAEAVARAVHADACLRPSPHGLSLYAGSAGDWPPPSLT